MKNWKLSRNEGPELRVRKPLRSKVAALSASFLKLPIATQPYRLAFF